MEQLLHYVWKHRLYPLAPLATTDGQTVEVIDPGLHNRNAGPDFFNAKVRIGGTLWVGNVEIHTRASDWYTHGHDQDARYDNVVLHVVEEADTGVVTRAGRSLPQLCLPVPEYVRTGYEALMQADHYPPCREVAGTLPRITVRSWLAALGTERLSVKADCIAARAGRHGASWEDACFITLARAFGFGVNSDAFEQWADSLPMSAVGHHRDDRFQVEAMFLGQAGLLSADTISPRHRAEAVADPYFQRLASEYAYLQRKFGLVPIDGSVWRFLRLRPQNFPYIRLSQLAGLYVARRFSLSQLADCADLPAVRRLFATDVSEYWRTHYTFGVESRAGDKRLSAASVDLLAVNVAQPLLFAYGRHRHDERLCERALTLLDDMRPENNAVVRAWHGCGITAETAADSQALVELKHQYCDRRDCLRCRFGYEYLKKGKMR